MKTNTILKYSTSLAIGLALTTSNISASYNIDTVAGTGAAGFSGDAAAATSATLNAPKGVCLDSSNNLFIADSGTNHVRKVVVGGNISTVGGTGTAGFSGDGGVATSANFNGLYGVSADGSGNVYTTDSINDRIREILASNDFVSTVAGTGAAGGFSGDGGAPSSALLNTPGGVCVDSAGNIYFADMTNGRIRMVAGETRTLGGITYTSGNIYTLASGLTNPTGVFVDSAKNVYFTDQSSGGTIKAFWGTAEGGGGSPYQPGVISDLATSAGSPTGVWVAPSSNITSYRVYFTDSTANVIKYFKITGTSATTTFNSFGTLSSPTALRGFADTGTNTDTLYCADTGNNVIKKLVYLYNGSGTLNSTVVVAGTSGTSGNTSSLLNGPRGLWVSANNGDIYISDSGNNAVRKVTSGGTTITTIAGSSSGTAGYSGDGSAATSALMSSPAGIWFNSSNSTVYFADKNNNHIRSFTVGGNIANVAGSVSATGGYAGDGSAATSALLNTPSGIFVDQTTSPVSIYFTDAVNNAVRMVNSSGVISTIAGGTTPTLATLNAPNGICKDASGNIYISDTSNHVIRKIPAAGGSISTIAGTVSSSGSTGDSAVATSALLNGPRGICADSSGNIFFIDQGNNKVRMIWNATTTSTYTNGNIYTIAGGGASASATYSGSGTAATLSTPSSICVDSTGIVYFSDQGNNVIRRLQYVAPSSTAFTIINNDTNATPASGLGYTEIDIIYGVMQMSSVPTYPVKFQASSGHTANAQITDNTNTGTFQFDTDGYVQVSTGKAATLNAAPTKSSSTSTTMHLNGAGIMKVLTDLSASAASTTPAVSVDAGILEVYGTTGKLPPVATSVTSGGKLQLGDASTPVVAAGAIPGAFDVASGGMVAVAAGVTAPNNVLGGAVTFHSGTILILGGGATWRQNMTISS